MMVGIHYRNTVGLVIPHHPRNLLKCITRADRGSFLDIAFNGHIRFCCRYPQPIRKINIAEDVFFRIHDINFPEPVISQDLPCLGYLVVIFQHRNPDHEILCCFHEILSSSRQREQSMTLSTRLRSSDIWLQRLHIPCSTISSRLISMRSARSSLSSLDTVRRSLTVTIPMTFFFASMTGSLLTLCFTIIWAASPTVFSALTVMSGVLMISLTCTLLGLRSFATTLQVMSSSVTIPIGLLCSRIMTLPTSSMHMAFAAFATVASIPIMVGLFFITSRNGIWVSNRISLVFLFMSHLLEVLLLMITISILPFTCINTIWQRQPAMQHSNI